MGTAEGTFTNEVGNLFTNRHACAIQALLNGLAFTLASLGHISQQEGKNKDTHYDWQQSLTLAEIIGLPLAGQIRGWLRISNDE